MTGAGLGQSQEPWILSRSPMCEAEPNHFSYQLQLPRVCIGRNLKCGAGLWYKIQDLYTSLNKKYFNWFKERNWKKLTRFFKNCQNIFLKTKSLYNWINRSLFKSLRSLVIFIVVVLLIFSKDLFTWKVDLQRGRGRGSEKSPHPSVHSPDRHNG